MGSASMPNIEKSSGPGKTAPRLLADLYHYDISRTSTNALIDFPAHHYDSNPDRAAFPSPPHSHILLLKNEQSDLISHSSPDTKKRYIVAAVCQKCRTHFDVGIEYPRGLGTSLCGRDNKNFPLHHFQYLESFSGVFQGEDAPGSRELEDKRAFRCSSPGCSALLCITSKVSMLDAKTKQLLDDRSLYPGRAKLAQQEFPYEDFPKYYPESGQFSLPLPPSNPAQALKALHAYLNNCLNDIKNGASKSIHRRNKRLLHNMGYDADQIFRKAHYKLDIVGDDPKGIWKPPYLSDQVRADIQDILTELKILSQLPAYRESGISYAPSCADKELQRLLACEKYDTTYQGRSSAPHEFMPRYANLGAIGDFSDDLLIWCFKRQIAVDKQNAPYYLECLMDFATGRKSEALEMTVATYRSEGYFSTSDVRDAYKALNLDPDKEYEPDVIIGNFRAHVSDAPRSEAQMRQAVLMIGTSMNSPAIVLAASKGPMNVNQAYEYFGAPSEIEPSFLISLYQIKIKDQPSEESTAKDALRLIANKLGSNILTDFLESGNVYDQPLDVSMAYSRLEADPNMDDDSLIAVYQIRLGESVNIEDQRQALIVIAESRKSDVIRTFLQRGETVSGTGRGVLIQGGRADWPVGLDNIGNTCYLNSLLQFYFTIKPLRDMILQFDLYQEDMNEEILRTKRVGGRKVTVNEVEHAKKFVGHLRDLFRMMITSKDASVKPEAEFARSALGGSKEENKEDQEKRRLSADAPPPVITLDDDLDTKMDVDNENSQNIDDGGSEITLVEKIDTKTTDEDFVMIDSDKKDGVFSEDKENLPPRVEPTANAVRPVLQDIGVDPSHVSETEGPQAPPTPPPETHDHPPPIPPRPAPKSATKHTDFTLGRQQDVAECIENVMFQIEAAIKPEDHDENGEQVDLVKKLFYGKTKQSLQLLGSNEKRSKIELFSHLLIDVADGSRDIYSALDSVFDVTTVNLEGKDTIRYLSISELPPVLQIQIQRVQFDRTIGKTYKSTAHLKFPETIYMDRYLDSSDPLLQAKREEAWAWKREIASLERRRAGLTNTSVGLDAPQTLDAVRSWIEEINDSEDKDLLGDAPLPELLNGLDNGIKESTEELNEINERLEVLRTKTAAQFEGLANHGYRIHSVFIHRGSVSFGHYWIYIYDFKEKIWRKYNDEYVTAATDPREVFEHLDSNNPATPYFLVFVREQAAERGMVEAVHRSIEEVENSVMKLD
ncbi:hypothetical protein BGX38DRAFT_1187333 [Terfezia claveryi]|nr:hypothetical protein BGX38DRAFT_1187333 [Terfezia claveryi]